MYQALFKVYRGPQTLNLTRFESAQEMHHVELSKGDAAICGGISKDMGRCLNVYHRYVYVYIYMCIYAYVYRVKCILLGDQIEQKQDSAMKTVPFI